MMLNSELTLKTQKGISDISLKSQCQTKKVLGKCRKVNEIILGNRECLK